MNKQLKVVKPKLISDQVFDQLRELIFRGIIKPGEKLLPERELAVKMNVSRVTIRTAIQRLVSMGLVTHRQGSGTFARDYSEELKNPLVNAFDSQPVSLEKILEIRMPLECNAAALAARRADAADIKALEHSYEEMVSENSQGRLGSQADASFHMAIAYATKNPLHIMIIRNFYDYIFHGIQETLTSVYTDTRKIQKIMDQHAQILEAIKKRSPDKASKVMEAHITFLINFITA